MRKIANLLVLLVIASMLLVACGAEATPTTAPAPTNTSAPPAATNTTAPPAATNTTAPAAATNTTAPAATNTTAAAEPTDTAAAAEATDTVAPAAGDATATPVPPKGSVEGTLTIWADKTRVNALQGIAKDFEAKYGVPVLLQELGFGAIRDQLKLAGPAGEGPDIIVGANDWVGELVTNGLLEPMPADLNGKASSFSDVSLRAFSYNGQLYGLPVAVEAVALIRNKDLVPEAPATWDELKQIAKDLQDSGKVDQGYVLQQGDPYHAYPFWTGNGSYVFGTNSDGSYNPQDVGLDNEGGIAAMKEIDSMVKEGLLRKDVNYDTMTSLFYQGKAAMFISGPWTLPDLKKSGINYGISVMPKMTRQMGPFVGAQAFMVSAFGKNKLLAQTFLTEYVATDEAMQSIYEQDPRGPAWKPLADSLDDEDIKQFAASAVTGQPLPAIPQMSAVWESWTKAINLVFNQQQDPESAIKDAATAIRDKIASGQ